MFEVINHKMFKPWLSFDWIFRFSSLYKVAKKHGFDRPNTLSDYLMRSNEEAYHALSKNSLNCSGGYVVDLLYKIRATAKYGEIKSEIDTTLIAVES